MKYFELVISVILLGIAILWLKNSSGSEFPYEPAFVAVGGLIPLVDSLRRFGFFSKIYFTTHNSEIHPWSFSGGKVDKTHIRVELTVENNKETNLLIRSIEIHSPISVESALGKSQSRPRLVDMEKTQNSVSLPISIDGKSSSTILIESTHDASSIEKYTQASNIGSLRPEEPFQLGITYSIGSTGKTSHVHFTISTSQLLTIVRSKYEESGDHNGVVKLLERT